jgi:N-acetylneuraminic acid mutarotase
MKRTTTFTIAASLLYAAAISAQATTITVTNGNDSGPGSLRQAPDQVYRLTGNILFFPTPTPTATGTPTPTPTCIPGGTPGPWTEAAVYPAAVYGAAVASNGANIYAFGGNTVGGAQHAEAYRYDPIANAWTALASMTTGPDYLFHAEYGGNAKIYVIGGLNGGTLNRIYDIATNTWSAGAPVPECVNDHGHAYYNGKVYVIGGWACGVASSAVYAYDVASNTWSAPLAPLPQTELNMATAAINGKIYVANGLYCHGQPPVCDTVNNLFIYDIAGNSWTSGPPSPLASEYPAGTAIGGKLYMIGGAGSNTYLYDPVANSWSSGPSLLIPRYFADAATALLPAVQTAVVVGGHNQGFSLNSVETSTLQDCGTPTPTPTATATATATPTPTATPTSTPRPSLTPRFAPTPRPRPTPPPRP